MPVFHERQRGTACCRWPGEVRLQEGRIAHLAVFKGLTEFAFTQKFTRPAIDRRGLALVEKPHGECVFLQGNDCTVQPVKPTQCRESPNLWSFPGFEKICHAFLRLVDGERHAQLVKAVTERRTGHG